MFLIGVGNQRLPEIMGRGPSDACLTQSSAPVHPARAVGQSTCELSWSQLFPQNINYMMVRFVEAKRGADIVSLMPGCQYLLPFGIDGFIRHPRIGDIFGPAACHSLGLPVIDSSLRIQHMNTTDVI